MVQFDEAVMEVYQIKPLQSMTKWLAEYLKPVLDELKIAAMICRYDGTS